MTVTAHYFGFEVDACNGNGMYESNSYIKAFVDVRIPEREFEIPPFSFKSANSGVKETEQLLHRARKLCVCGQDDEQSPFLGYDTLQRVLLSGAVLVFLVQTA